MTNKPQWVLRKYMGDDQHSWAIIDKRYLPKGHRGVVMEWLPEGAVSYSGLCQDNKAYYLKKAKQQSQGVQPTRKQDII
jgi:hypothetical protein